MKIKITITILAVSAILYWKATLGQEFKKFTDTPIYATANSNDNKLIAFADWENVYIMSSDSFTILNEWSFDWRKKGIVSEMEFSPVNPNILFIRYSKFNNEVFSIPQHVYPDDSLFIFETLSGKEIGKAPGNCLTAFSRTDKGVFVYNNFHSYQGSNNTPSFWSKSSEFIIYPEKEKYELGKTVKDIVVSPDDKYLAISCFDSLSEAKYYYSLEIRSLTDFSLKAKKSDLSGQPSSLTFSDDSKYLYLTEVNNDKMQFHILNSEDLSIPKTFNIEKLHPLISNNHIITMRDRDIVNINLSTGEEEWKLWPNLTSLFDFNGFVPISVKEILVFGERFSGISINKKQGGIEKINIEDLEIYVSNQQESSSDIIFDPLKLSINFNYWASGNLVISPDKKYLAGFNTFGDGENYLEIWSVIDKRKLHHWLFEKKIYAVAFDNKAEYMMIIEEYNQKDFDSYKLHIIDLIAGKMESKIFEDEPYGFFSPSQINVNCYPVPAYPGKWICSDKSDALWEIDHRNTSIKEVFRADKNTQKYKVWLNSIPLDHEKILLETISYNTDNYHNRTDVELDSLLTFDLRTYKTKRLEDLENILSSQAAFIISENIVTSINTDGSLSFLDMKNKSELKRFNFKDETLENVRLSNDKHSALLTSRKKEVWNGTLICRKISMDNFNVQKQFNISYPDNYEIFEDQLLFTDKQNVYLTSKTDNTIQSWNSSSEIFIEYNDLSLSNSGYLLFKKEILIDLSTLKMIPGIIGFYDPVLLTGENAESMLQIYSESYNVKNPFYQFRIVNIYDSDTPTWESKKFSYGKKEFLPPVNEVKLSPCGRYAIIYNNGSYNDKNEAYLIHLASKDIIYITDKKITSVDFTQDGSKFLINTNKRTKEGLYEKKNIKSNIYDSESGKLIKAIDDRFDAFMPDNTVLKAEMYGVDHCGISGDTLEYKQTYNSRQWINVCHYNESKNQILAGSKDGSLFVWDIERLSPVEKIQCGASEIISIIESEGKLFVLMKNATVKIIDINTWEEILSLNFNSDEDDLLSHSWFTPEGYFRVDKNQLINYHFVKGIRAFPLSSYELYFNRPDIILSRLGFADSSLTGVYYKAYEKRLRKSGIIPGKQINNFRPPLVSIQEKQSLQQKVSSDNITLNIIASDTIQNLKEIQVLVNGVPIKGSGGIPILRGNSFSDRIEIPLNQGKNSIKIFAINESGIESLPESVEIISTKSQSKSVYYIGIGISDYMDSNFNLVYAAKDIRDMAEKFKEQYPGIIIDTLINNDATKENILKLKDRLLQTSLDDLVILSISGHGILDKNFDFNYATYDMDFKQPSTRGLPYSMIESLLDSIPARQKLLLLDACHSGEVDKEAIRAYASDTTDNKLKSGIRKYTYRANILQDDEIQGLGLQNSFELMQELFSNLNRGSGTVVISAAAGDSYAMESDEWKNGVFTYSILKGLQYMAADKNGDDEISVSELRDYVSKSVQDLTNGLQKPTMRQENVEFDFRVW